MTFDDFVSECLHYNVHVCRGRKVVCIKSSIVSTGQLFGLTDNALKRDFQNARARFLV